MKGTKRKEGHGTGAGTGAGVRGGGGSGAAVSREMLTVVLIRLFSNAKDSVFASDRKKLKKQTLGYFSGKDLFVL